MKAKGADKVQLSWEKVKTRFTFGAKGEEKVDLLQRNATVSGRPAELSWGKVCGKRRAQAPPTETGRGEKYPRRWKAKQIDLIGKVMHICGSEFGVGICGSEFWVDICGSEFGVGICGSEFGVGICGSEFGVGICGSGFGVGLPPLSGTWVPDRAGCGWAKFGREILFYNEEESRDGIVLGTIDVLWRETIQEGRLITGRGATTLESFCRGDRRNVLRRGGRHWKLTSLSNAGDVAADDNDLRCSGGTGSRRQGEEAVLVHCYEKGIHQWALIEPFQVPQQQSDRRSREDQVCGGCAAKGQSAARPACLKGEIKRRNREGWGPDRFDEKIGTARCKTCFLVENRP
ncbi:hypothetical protein B0H13DRAFT_1890296 [Mycena leptocephala]|nr:hypothetical protein B0H13DRAFT_1890296 [Mycena leptocephala]